MAEASRAARKAIEIDVADAGAYEIVSFTSLFSKRLDIATVEIERAIELSPNSAQARSFCAGVYCFDGRPHEGVEQAKLALRLSPRHWSRFTFFHHLALCLYSSRDYVAAAQAATQVVALKPDYLYGHWHMAGSCAQLGQTERAQTALQEVLRLNPNFNRAFVESVAPFRNTADLEHFIEGLQKAGWDG